MNSSEHDFGLFKFAVLQHIFLFLFMLLIAYYCNVMKQTNRKKLRQMCMINILMYVKFYDEFI